ncbi:hypothetical protein C1645_819434 [Glomus cerebriforme]|uniref:GPR1/FUN34/yaaH family-domain-containing protein n=1 Tax=Glomus cerebriforme TaxID=658196 RepID=A0A397TEH1_9GLOM|nr:hypothetical protein C1645_819434 [Glomus cerebriforme]
MPEPQIYVQDYVKPEKIRHSSTTKKHAPKLGNPTPLGLSSFAICMMVSGFYNFRAFGVNEPNVMVGLCLFTGGIVQFAAGMWEFKVGNTFGGTGFSAFGGFWASLGVIFIPSFGILDAFRDGDNFKEAEFHNAMAVFTLAWLIFTIIFTIACIRTSVGVLSAFVFLTMTFANEVIYHFTGGVDLFIKAAGISGLLCSGAVWYCLGATFLTPDLSPISLPLWDLSHKEN